MAIGDYTTYGYQTSFIEQQLNGLLALMQASENRATSNVWREQQHLDNVARIARATEAIAFALETLSADLLQKAYEKAKEDLKQLLEKDYDSTAGV